MAILKVITDFYAYSPPILNTYPTIETAIAAAFPGDTIILGLDYGPETVTVTQSNITISGTSSSLGIELVIGDGVSGLVISGEAPINVTDSGGDDTVSGNDGDNIITVTGGNDVINSGSGDDRLVVDYSATTAAITGTTTTISSDQGTVTVIGSSIEHYTVSTGPGIDTLTFMDGDNVIDAGTTGGNTITVGSGNNTIISGSGIDGIIAGNGDNYIDGGEGANTITAGPTGAGNNTIISGNGIDGIIAGNGDNHIDAGTIGANTITAGSGNNTIISGSGIDGITAGNGDNYIDGGEGANTITVGPTGFGNNTIISGSGIDGIIVGNGDNCIDAGTIGANTITAGSGNNTIISGSGIDGFTVGDGNNYIDGGEGANTIAVGNGSNTIISGSGIDTIIAGNGGNSIEGGEGANAITTGTGNDVVSSGSAADTTVTGAGNDIIKDTGGAGGITAGAGHDRLIMDFSNATAAVTNTVTGAESHGGMLGGTTYSGVEEFHITAGSGNDTLLGGDGADVLDGGAGANNLSAGGASDVIFGGVGDVVDGGENIDGNDFDVLVLKDFGSHRIDLDNLLDPESGTVVQLDSDGNETGSVTFTGIESIEFVDNTVTTPEDSTLEGILFSTTATTTVTQFVVGTTTYLAGDTAARTEGDLTINSDGSYVFIPAPNYNGPGPVTTYTTIDTLDPLSSGTSSLKVNVEPVDEIQPVCVFDVTAPEAPTVTITEDTNDDGLISAAELSDVDLAQVNVTIDLPDGAVVGDTLTITTSDPTALNINTVLSETDITAGAFSVSYAAPAVGDTITVSAVITDAASNTSAAGSDSAGVICFAEGTLITTADGEIPIENLQVGDLIQTLDRGLQPLRWIGRRYLDAHELAENDNLRPIRISHNVIGLENCDHDLVVSPQHRILIASRVAERMFGTTEVIIAAKHLLAIEGVDIAADLNHVTYFHILLDEHVIVYANKVPAESLYLGCQAQLSLSAAGRAEILALFPEVASPSFIPTSCRAIICNKRARKLARRHMINNKPFLNPQNGDYQPRLL